MAWLIAIVCIILVVIFWRILAPVAVVAAIGIGLLFLYLKVDSDQSERKRIQAQQEVQDKIARANAAVRERIAKAKTTVGPIDREWEVATETDPASGEKVPRTASVMSDNGLCRLQVEQRINATRLAGIYCLGLKVSPDADIEVKFDNRSTSDKMKLQKFSNGEDVYISSSRSTYGGQLQYDEFLQRTTTAKKVALLLTIEGAGQHWITFSLVGSAPALTKIGAISPGRTETQESPQKKAGGTQANLQKKSSGTQASPQKSPSGAQRPREGGATPTLPANAKLNVYGNDWVCIRGYRQTGNECVAVQLPSHAELNVYGNDWKCVRGYRRSGNKCVAVQLPSHAELNVYGNDWKCVRGYRRTGSECVAVQLPSNAEFNVYGNDWKCVRGYRRSGSECIPVGVLPTSGS